MQLAVQRLLGTNTNSSVRTLRAVPTNLWGWPNLLLFWVIRNGGN